MKAKIISLTILLSVLAVFIVANIYPNFALGDEEDLLTQYREDQAAIEAAKDDALSALNSADSTLSTFEKQIAALEIEIEAVEDEIYVLEKSLVSADIQMQVANNELVVEEENLATRQSVLSARLYETYVGGSTSLIDVFLDSSSMEDFLTQSYYLEKILDQDLELIDEIELAIVAVEEKKAVIAEKEAAYQDLLDIQEDLKEDLVEQQDEKYILYAAAEDEVENAQAAYDALAAEEAAMEEQIRQLLLASSGGTGTGYFIWPLPTSWTTVSSDYGYRIHPTTGLWSLHTGIDLPATAGTNIYAADSGVVIMSEYYGAYGYCVIIDHGNGLSTLYGHSSQLIAEEGDVVVQGDVIALVGTTGWSTGNHLHFSVLVDGEYVDPWDYVSLP